MSKLASVIAAAFLALVGYLIPTGLPISPELQGALAGVVGALGVGLFPALSAQFDEQRGMLFGTIGVVVAGVVDYFVLQTGISEQVQGGIIALLNAVLSLFAPALTLQQASRFRPAVGSNDTRPLSRAA